LLNLVAAKFSEPGFDRVSHLKLVVRVGFEPTTTQF
jgi:hypothetical protein